MEFDSNLRVPSLNSGSLGPPRPWHLEHRPAPSMLDSHCANPRPSTRSQLRFFCPTSENRTSLSKVLGASLAIHFCLHLLCLNTLAFIFDIPEAPEAGLTCLSHCCGLESSALSSKSKFFNEYMRRD